MKLKICQPLILYLLLITLPSWAGSPTESKPASADEYGIDCEVIYSGQDVQQIIRIITEEAETAIDEAFAEGYKQGLLASAPEAEYWKIKALTAEQTASRYKKDRWIFAAAGFAGGVVFGYGISFTFRF